MRKLCLRCLYTIRARLRIHCTKTDDHNEVDDYDDNC